MSTPFDYEELRNRIEQLVNAYSIEIVIEALYDVCFIKAEHLRSNWQDENMASGWEEIGQRLEKLI